MHFPQRFLLPLLYSRLCPKAMTQEAIDAQLSTVTSQMKSLAESVAA
jgi:hypothetical protein